MDIGPVAAYPDPPDSPESIEHPSGPGGVDTYGMENPPKKRPQYERELSGHELPGLFELPKLP
jgi:hypothetical protein